MLLIPSLVADAVRERLSDEGLSGGRRFIFWRRTLTAARARSFPAEWAWLRAEAPAHVADRGGIVDGWLDGLVVRRIEDGSTGVRAFYGRTRRVTGPAE